MRTLLQHGHSLGMAAHTDTVVVLWDNQRADLDLGFLRA